MDSKVCFKCGVEKPLVEFYKHKQMGDGHLNKCKSCTKKDAGNHRKLNIEKIREYDRSRSTLQHRVELRKSTCKKYREEYPDRYKAHCKVSNALRDGRLVRPERCDMCGTECNPHAHHWSYLEEHWLDVEWLCVPCHTEWHHERQTKFLF